MSTLPPGKYVLLSNFAPETPSAEFVTVEAGEIVTVGQSFEGGWSHATKADGTAGFVPTGFLTPYQDQQPVSTEPILPPPPTSTSTTSTLTTSSTLLSSSNDSDVHTSDSYSSNNSPATTMTPSSSPSPVIALTPSPPLPPPLTTSSSLNSLHQATSSGEDPSSALPPKPKTGSWIGGRTPSPLSTDSTPFSSAIGTHNNNNNNLNDKPILLPKPSRPINNNMMRPVSMFGEIPSRSNSLGGGSTSPLPPPLPSSSIPRGPPSSTTSSRPIPPPIASLPPPAVIANNNNAGGLPPPPPGLVPGPKRVGPPPAAINRITSAMLMRSPLLTANSSSDSLPGMNQQQSNVSSELSTEDHESIEKIPSRFQAQSDLFDKISKAFDETMAHSKGMTDSLRLLELLTREYAQLDYSPLEVKRGIPDYLRTVSELMLQLSQVQAQFSSGFSSRVIAPVHAVRDSVIPPARVSQRSAQEATQKRVTAEAKLQQMDQKSKLKLEKLQELEKDFKSALASEGTHRKDSTIAMFNSYERTNYDLVRALSSTVDLLHSSHFKSANLLEESLSKMANKPPIFNITPPTKLEAYFQSQSPSFSPSNSSSSLLLSSSSSSSSSGSSFSHGTIIQSSSSTDALSKTSSLFHLPETGSDPVSKHLRSLLSDEKSFLSELGLIVDVYRTAVDDKLSRQDLPDIDKKEIFGNVTQVVNMHTRLFEELQNVIANWPNVMIGAVFLDKVNDIDSAYVPFLGGHSRSVETAAKWAKQSKAFGALLRDEGRRNGIRPLEELLRLPLNRLSYYTQWIKEMLALLDDLANLQSENPLLKEQLELMIEADDLFGSKVIDIERREMMADNLARVMQISQQVTGCGNLMLPDRRYVADEVLHSGSGDSSSDHVFLFNDILLLVRKEGPKYKFVQEIPLHRVQPPLIKDGSSAFTLLDTGPPEVAHEFSSPSKPGLIQIWANAESGLVSRQIKEVELATKVFGVSLPVIMRREKGRIVPQFIEKTCDYILEKAVREEGIFRLSGKATQIAQLKAQFNLGKKIFFSEDMDPNSVSGLIKLWFRELPEPLLTWNLYEDFSSVIELETNEDKVARLHDAIAKLPQANKYVLQYLMKVCFIITQNSDANKMSAQNLGVVFGPNLLKSRDNSDPANNYLVVQAMIQNYHELFDQIETEASDVMAKLEQEENEQAARRKQRQQEREQRLATVKTELSGSSQSSSSSSSSSVVSTSAIVREGWLQINTDSKKATMGSKKSWKTVWAVLRYKSFCYFKNKKDTKPKDRIVLSNCLVGSSTVRDFCFCLSPPNSTTVFLVAVNHEDLEQWIAAFESCNERT